MEKSKCFDIPQQIQVKIKDKQWVKDKLKEGEIAQNLIGFSEEVMNNFYKAACELFEAKRYLDASNAFLFLATLNPYHYDYWLGLGAATQHCEDYEAAIDSYEMAAICQINNPLPYFHLAKCLFAMHDRASSLQALELALEYADDISEYDDIRRQALAAKTLLLKEQ